MANLSQLGIVQLSCVNSETDQVVYPVRRGFVPEFMREKAIIILEELLTVDSKLYPGLVEILCYIAWKYSSTDLTIHYSNDPNNESTKYFALKQLLHQAIYDCDASYVHKYKMCTLAENHELFKDLSVKCMHFIRTYVENNPIHCLMYIMVQKDRRGNYVLYNLTLKAPCVLYKRCNVVFIFALSDQYNIL